VRHVAGGMRGARTHAPHDRERERQRNRRLHRAIPARAGAWVEQPYNSRAALLESAGMANAVRRASPVARGGDPCRQPSTARAWSGVGGRGDAACLLGLGAWPWQCAEGRDGFSRSRHLPPSSARRCRCRRRRGWPRWRCGVMAAAVISHGGGGDICHVPWRRWVVISHDAGCSAGREPDRGL